MAHVVQREAVERLAVDRRDLVADEDPRVAGRQVVADLADDERPRRARRLPEAEAQRARLVDDDLVDVDVSLWFLGACAGAGAAAGPRPRTGSTGTAAAATCKNSELIVWSSMATQISRC